MFKFRKYIASILILALLCSLLPSYTGASSDNTSQTIQNEKETINTDNLDEVVKERTESSKTFTDGEGNFVKEIYPEEIHNKVDGKYKTISEELVESDNKGYIETETTNLEFMFPEKLGQDKPLIYQSGEHKLSFELTHASDGEKQTEPTYTSGSVKEDNSITHKSLYPNIDLRHVALNNEVKEDWIMNEYNGINEFHYTIQTDLYGQVEKDGSIGFYENESKEKSVFTLPKPVMVDSNYNDTLGDGVRSTDIHYDLNKKSDDSYELVLNASKEWLSSSKRVFPIYIDPSVSIDALGDTFVMSAYPNNNYNKEWDPSQGEYVLKTGYYDSTTGTNYPFIKFSVIGDLKGAAIDSAELAAYVTHSYYVDTKTDIWVDEVKAQWYVDELTWNNKPSSTKITSTSVARDQWAYFDVKNTIQAWVNGTRENYGFKFHTNGNGKTHWKKITAAESAKKAKLVISYHYEKMKNPTVSSYSYGEGKADGYIDVKWGSVHGAKSYDLQMYDGKSYQTIYSGTSTSWSSKGKKIFPKAPYSTSTTYKTDSTGVELPVDPSAFYSAKSGTTTTKKDYGFRVIAKFANGNSPASTAIYKSIPVVQVGIPDIPTVKPYAYPETDTVNKGRGWLDISWKPVTNATGYKVLIWNGTKYKEFSVGKVTSVSTKGKKIWPTDADLKNEIKELYLVELDKSTSIGKGTELPIDPSITYGNGSNRYSIRVKAISAAGDSASSDVNYGYIPLYAPKNAKLTSNLVDMVNNKSSLTVKWDATPSAKYYEVQISDDKTSKIYQVKGNTSFTSEPIYGVSSNYSATVKAYFVDDDNASETEQGKVTGNRGLSPASNKATASVDPREDLNGLEDYFTYEDHSFGNATASVNVTTGNMVMEFTDQSLFTQGLLGFDFTRYYNSRSTRTSALGQGWTFAGNENLVEADATSTEPAKVIYYDEDGTKHEFSYDSSNKKYISPKGKYLTLTKETVNGAQGFILKEKDGLSKIFEGNSSKNREYRLYAYKDNNQNTIRFFYTLDKLSEISEVNQQGDKIRTSIQLTYNTDGLINKVGYGSNWKEIGYQNKQLASIVTKDSRTTESITERLSYNSLGQLASYVDGKGNETKYLYDENELKVFDKQEKDASISVSTTYRYDQAKNEFTVTDTDDNETVYKRDMKKGTFAVSEIMNSDETTSSFQYDDQYNVLQSVDEEGLNSTNSYDSNGNLKTTSDPNGTTSYEYDSKNRVTKTTDPKGTLTINTYEGENLSSTKIGEETTKYEYDSFGRKTKVIYPNKTYLETNYDDLKQKITIKDPKGQYTSTSYDQFGNIKSKTDAGERTVSYEYHPLQPNVISGVTDGKGKTTNYKYDKNGNITNLSDALGRNKTYEYNDNDQLNKATFPGMIFTYDYNSNGNIANELQPSGNKLHYSYDEMNQVESVTASTPSKGELLQSIHTYTDGGQVESLTYKDLESDQTLLQKDFTYYDTDLLKSYKQGKYNIGYTYDENERPLNSTISYAQNNTPWMVEQSLKYTDDGKKDRRTVGVGEQNWMMVDYDYDLVNNQNKVTVNDNLFQRTNTFNQSNLLESIDYTQGNDTSIRYDYKYDGSGNIKEERSEQGVVSFTFDENSQLTQEELPDGTINKYSYDEVGNRKESTHGDKTDTFTYNAGNQIETKNGKGYQYDDDGNLLQDEKFKYEYNALGYQTRVTDLQGNEVARYDYDEAGLRTKKIIGKKTHEYYYDGNQLTLEVLWNGESIEQYRNYQWEGYTPIGMIIREKDESGNWKEQVYHYWTNHRGDVVSIRDNKGKEVGSYTYDTYGNVLTEDGGLAQVNPIRYAGYYYDVETKNYYLQARYYNPENGSFLALDPQPGDEDDPISQNGYTYADNNPVNYIDPDGNDAMWITASNGASGFGHTSLVLYGKGNQGKGWYYFYFGNDGNIALSKPKVVVKFMKKSKPSLKYISDHDGYKYKFDKSVYIKGSFQKSLDYAYYVKSHKTYYSVGLRNCLMLSGKVLNKSISWKNKWKVDNAVALKTPNMAHKAMARYF
ncbi:DNRLRE domain-containing protein [Peribacillus frigoritolerans]|uniref:DNRLRE domain-containing protein n=1 Tax=Peribacillus frigoritolerans TaxID=450367 RepID=UPI00209D26D7|nr:DNRLRE domain-containing protein [Peribacillus frigoritolerans]MCP1155010.1 DNRLRE domain-containing protein [Peribacillus frigoritolerans]